MPRITILFATKANMERTYHSAKLKPFAYSAETHERYSAHPGDYWQLRTNDCLKDEIGNRMVLATEHCEIRPVV